jgi:hypothetical protein
MRYRGVINFDIEGSGAGPAANPRTQLYAALRHLGWEKAQTTALVIETNDINSIWKGIVCFIKAQGGMGTALSAVTFNVQRTDEPGNPPDASVGSYDTVMGKDFPWV